MNHRTKLGREADVRDITARLKADPNATERIYAALDYVADRRRDGGRIASALRRLTPRQRRFAKAVLSGLTWRSMGVSKATFYRELKNIEDFFAPENNGQNPHRGQK